MKHCVVTFLGQTFSILALFNFEGTLGIFKSLDMGP